MNVLNQKQLELFCCPKCHGYLDSIDSLDEWLKKEQDLYCKPCEQRYPVIKGIPFFVELYSTGWMGMQSAYELWQKSKTNIPFKEFMHDLQRYSNVTYGNYEDLIMLSHALGSKDIQDFAHIASNAPYAKEWMKTQNQVYEWVFREALQLVSDDQVIIDVGVGGATVETYLSKHLNPTNTIIGMDISHRELFLNRDKLPENVVLTCGDFRQSPLKENSVDLIISTGGFQHIDHFEEALNEFLRVLKPKGKIVMMAFETWPHDESLQNVYNDIDIPVDGLKLIERFKEKGFHRLKFEDNIANHPNFNQFGAVFELAKL